MNLHPGLAEAIEAFRRGDLQRARALAETSRDESSAAAPAHHLLGLIDCRTGDYASGAEHFRSASEAEPANLEHKLMLARSLIDSGQPAESLAIAEAQTGSSPAAVAFLHVRAEASAALGDRQSAAQAWARMTELRPSDWKAWSNLGDCQAADGQWPEAARALQRAASLAPREPAIRRNLAAALAAVGAPEESLEQFQAAIALDPGNAATALGHANLLDGLGRHEEALAGFETAQRLGADSVAVSIGRGRALLALARFDEAADAYGAALESSPADLVAHRELGLLLERTGQIDALRRLVDGSTKAGLVAGDLAYLRAALALRDGQPEQAKTFLLGSEQDDDPVRWHRLMAKIADALDDPDLAFASAEAMNRATPGFAEWRSRGAAYRARTRDLLPLFAAERLAGLYPLPPSSRAAPVFLVGFPRSGTTLLDTFLMGHSRMAVLEEQPMLDAAEQAIGGMQNLPSASLETLSAARDAYFAELDRHVDPGFGGLVVDKLPLNMLGMPLIHALFPDARIIFAQRHPCDAVLSGFMQSFVLNDAMACFLDLEDAADLYDLVLSIWSRASDGLPLHVHTIVYEDLVAAPEVTIRPLIDFLGLEWSDALLDHRSTASERGAILTPSYDQVTQPLTQRPVGRWRRMERHLEPVLAKLLPWARRLGYAD